MRCLLVLQFQGESLGDYDRMVALEERLIEVRGSSADVDGHDFGSGETNIFTSNPAETFEQARRVLQSTGQLSVVTAAYRAVEDGQFSVLWPKDSTQRFFLK